MAKPKCHVMLGSALLWWFYFSSTATPATCLVHEADRSALIAFKLAIDQDPFGVLSSWNVSLHYCDWEGVLCSRRHGERVVELNLTSQALVGTLSPHIGNLSFLQSLVLSKNGFHGPIPQQIGRLSRLRNLVLSNNSFQGEIPANVSRCANLELLNLISNNLSGNIPDELGTLPKLIGLGLTYNSLSGTIPPSLGNLSFLSKLSLGACGLHGEIPKEIGRLHSLKFLQLSQNNLSGEIPAGIYNISSLSMFQIFSNQFRGSIPPDIGSSLPNLQILHLLDNQFTGMLPVSLSNASGLQQVNFGLNGFVGPIPRDLGSLKSLWTLILLQNRLQDDFGFFSSLTNCTSLKIFVADNNLLKGSLPDSFANLSASVKVITLADNQLFGTIPSGIGNLLNLTYLDLSMNLLTGPIPTTFGKLGKLQELYLQSNKLTEIPSSIGNLTLLNGLHLEQNSIYGSIPPSISNCSSLLEIYLSENYLNGSIPPGIMSLSSISIAFSLAHNALTGSLPPEVGSLKNLVEFDVSNNRLSGPIPSSLSNCLSLQRLRLESNSFEGEIPQILRDMKGLEELDLSSNNLSGPIPSFLGELQLAKLNLSFNKLSGEVPLQGVFENGSAVSLVGNILLCGGIPGLNLPPCSSSRSHKNKLFHKRRAILLAVAVFLACLALLGCFLIFLCRQRVSRKKESTSTSPEHRLWRVSYAELLKATDRFSGDNLIGAGHYGTVFKGILDQGRTVVAVKVFNLQVRGASKSFISECNALRTIRHRNLLKILSACSSTDYHGNEFKVLVCEFMANGSLEKWLHQGGDKSDEQREEHTNLTLTQRLNVAIDVASAVEYLHCHCDSTVVHGDLKPSNVLLDKEMTAHVGDFGLAKIISTMSTEVGQQQSNTIAVRGTIGYVAPEYGMGDGASTLADVYSYGILVLEMFTGKRPTDSMFKDDVNLHSFVESALPDQAMDVLDPRLCLENEQKSWIKESLVSILTIGVRCSMESPRDRMQIGDVVVELCKIRNAIES